MRACLLLLILLSLHEPPACAEETVGEIVGRSTVVFTTDRGSVKTYGAELESQTGVTVLVDRGSLQRHGISVNEPIRMPRRQLSVADALDMMAEKAAHTNPGKVLWKIDEKQRAVVIYGK